MSLKRKLWAKSKPFIIKSGATLLISALLPPRYVPMATNLIFKFFGISVGPVPRTPRGAYYQGYEQEAMPQQAYVGKRKVGKATFRKVLLLGSGVIATGLSGLLAYRFLLKPKFGKKIYSNEPKAFGKLEKNEEVDEHLANQQQPSRMVERLEKSEKKISYLLAELRSLLMELREALLSLRRRTVLQRNGPQYKEKHMKKTNLRFTVN
jgi:hypothetical protein